MKGLELSERFYIKYGKSMIETEFNSVANRIAVGLVGEGSECLGFDDNISADHDFEPGFCLWLTPEDDADFGHSLRRAYEALPKEYGGFRRNQIAPVGGNRHGVMTIDGFYRKFLGSPTLPETLSDWLYIPTSALCCGCNGKVFRDDLGEFSKVRSVLLQGYPDDVRRKKIAAHCIFIAQSGLYNYHRCIKRGETGAAQLAVFSFVRHTISVIYLLNNVYEPFYKWVYRGLKSLPVLNELGDSLTALTELGNQPHESQAKMESMEEIAICIIKEIQKQGLTKIDSMDIEKQALAVIKGIRDNQLRNMHIMEGVKDF